MIWQLYRENAEQTMQSINTIFKDDPKKFNINDVEKLLDIY